MDSGHHAASFLLSSNGLVCSRTDYREMASCKADVEHGREKEHINANDVLGIQTGAYRWLFGFHVLREFRTWRSEFVVDILD